MPRPKKKQKSISDKYTLVIVEWIDIASDASWVSEKDAQKMECVTCIEVGWMIHEDKKQIVLSSQFNDSDCGNRTVIPRGVILDIKRINNE